MYLSLNWLKNFISIPSTISPQELGSLLTLHTAEVEKIIIEAEKFQNMVIGEVVELKKHPNADKLFVCKVNIGKEINQIVCGGINLREKMLVPVALPGAYIRWHGEGDLIKLEKVKLRGEESNGMICAGEEIGIEKAPANGITDLSHLKVKPGTPLAEALNFNDVIFEIDNKSLTNRPDLWGHYGIARELSVILNLPLKKLSLIDEKTLPTKKGKKLKIEIKDFKLCPRYIGTLITNIEIKKSPVWLKKRLESINIRSINNIVDITNYVMAELGQPMHAFDKNLIEEGIIVRTAKNEEKITTLDGENRILTEEMLVIADHKKPIAIAGIMGAENSEIKNETKEIILESANFNAINVRKTSSRLNLRTESLQRYEKGIDPDLTKTAALRAIELILEVCPESEIVNSIEDIKNYEPKDIEISLNLERCNSKIGKNISEKQIEKILTGLEFKVKKEEKNFKVSVPEFRAQGDVKIEDDLIEEIARMYGYDNLEPTLPPLPIKLPIKNTERLLKHEARNILSHGLNFTETYNYSFYSEKDLVNCLLPKEKHIKVKNYLSMDQTHMRLSLLPNILKAIQTNLKNNNEFNIFEFGRIYEKTEKSFWPLEKKMILACMVRPENYQQEVFLDIKGILETFLERFKFSGRYKLEKPKNPENFVHPGKYVNILIEGKNIGKIYIPHPQVLKNFDIQAQIGIFELNFALVRNELGLEILDKEQRPNFIASLGQKEIKYKPLPKFPGISFDVSVTIDKEKLYKDIYAQIEKSSELIKQIELFDIYTGDKISSNKKNLAFRILLQNLEKTLTDEDMQKAQKEVFANLQKIGGEIRGL
ncbi:MAG: Phenylalanine-tRNA ligase beta subunit [Candidatus Peregrinibacteria bacterium GW2011_GWA2_33_10]|nr:MAG: Phenylalanine-tRNA ligase beta subunit [Candidatus Peregrinibacteria bacterium GW2011_GWA2_33_10]KKP40949.1 MAG: phenylalanyl-tRNA synthetase subunit beta, phenylalanyl-tRNA synthetase beta chain [Candidatus Peregrinibacteria bacterium GW2011_GWC2_33_13]OGJ49570.1 MAG: phenylalanine--tRNA ligase subunit beta [Candidatus Peregrinibacteria bacterium RIFOXYA2_FULL_33_7]